MEKIIFTLLIFSQSLSVNGTITELVSKTINEVVNLFVKTFRDVSGKVENFFVNRYADKLVPPINNPHTSSKPFVKDDLSVGSSHQPRIKNIRHLKSVPISPSAPPLPFWQGRDMESHSILTKDGYYLTVHRVYSNLQANRTVLLHHGLLGSSADWILLGGDKSLPFILSETGYDVWITNARGNYYSRGHVTLTLDNEDYWNFSWQEMGELDLPAVIDYIRQAKNFTESISFIGHSMGATALLVLLSTLPKYNEYLRLGIFLAPIAFMNNVKGPISVMAGASEEIIKLMGTGEFLPSREVPFMFASKYCNGPEIFCKNPLFFLSGFNEDERWNNSFISRLLYYLPAGGSMNTLLHYWQVARSGVFHRYNQPQSQFSLKNITLPIALISSSDDWLAPIPDVLTLFFSLKNPIDHHIIRNMNVTHTSFVWGADAHVLVYDKILEYLENGLFWNNMLGQNDVIDSS